MALKSNIGYLDRKPAFAAHARFYKTFSSISHIYSEPSSERDFLNGSLILPVDRVSILSRFRNRQRCM